MKKIHYLLGLLIGTLSLSNRHFQGGISTVHAIDMDSVHKIVMKDKNI